MFPILYAALSLSTNKEMHLRLVEKHLAVVSKRVWLQLLWRGQKFPAATTSIRRRIVETAHGTQL